MTRIYSMWRRVNALLQIVRSPEMGGMLEGKEMGGMLEGKCMIICILMNIEVANQYGLVEEIMTEPEIQLQNRS